MNEAYQVQKHLPKSLAVGDNQAGSAVLTASKGIYLVPFGCLDLEERRYLAPSLHVLLVEGVGIEAILAEG